MVVRSTPEDAVGVPKGPPVLLSLRCGRCETVTREAFDWVCLNPQRKADRVDDWDGVTLSRMVVCSKCGAVDGYELAGDSYLKLSAGALESLEGGSGGRVFVAENRLWDGTLVRRPSQALARLRELTVEQPRSAEAQRRLGNGCWRFGLLTEAQSAYRRAIELEPDDLESLAGLAQLLLDAGASTEDEGQDLIARAVRILPQARYPNPAARRSAVQDVLAVIRVFARGAAPVALRAAWNGRPVAGQPVVHVSLVDLRKVVDVWDELVSFVASSSLISLEITDEVPSEPSQLEMLLTRQQPMVAAPRVGRNEPCPCGSGKKFKRCCGDQGAARSG